MGRFLVVGAEHLNALRDQVVWALAGAATYVGFDRAPMPWLDIPGIAPPQVSKERDDFLGRLLQKISSGCRSDPSLPRRAASPPSARG